MGEDLSRHSAHCIPLHSQAVIIIIQTAHRYLIITEPLSPSVWSPVLIKTQADQVPLLCYTHWNSPREQRAPELRATFEPAQGKGREGSFHTYQPSGQPDRLSLSWFASLQVCTPLSVSRVGTEMRV